MPKKTWIEYDNVSSVHTCSSLFCKCKQHFNEVLYITINCSARKYFYFYFFRWINLKELGGLDTKNVKIGASITQNHMVAWSWSNQYTTVCDCQLSNSHNKDQSPKLGK